jgi:hypothetical protein
MKVKKEIYFEMLLPPFRAANMWQDLTAGVTCLMRKYNPNKTWKVTSESCNLISAGPCTAIK